MGSSTKATKLLIVNQLGNRWVVSTHRAAGIALEFDLVERHIQSVEDEQTPGQWPPYAKYELDGFRRLYQADYTWKYTKDTCFLTTGHCSRRWWSWETITSSSATWLLI